MKLTNDWTLIMDIKNLDEILRKTEHGISEYLSSALEKGQIDLQLYNIASTNTYKNIKELMVYHFLSRTGF